MMTLQELAMPSNGRMCRKNVLLISKGTSYLGCLWLKWTFVWGEIKCQASNLKDSNTFDYKSLTTRAIVTHSFVPWLVWVTDDHHTTISWSRCWMNCRPNGTRDSCGSFKGELPQRGSKRRLCSKKCSHIGKKPSGHVMDLGVQKYKGLHKSTG